MLILLPNQTQSIDGLTRALQHYPFASIVRQLDSTEVFVNIPRFEIDFNADIRSILQQVSCLLLKVTVRVDDQGLSWM